jgi:hypothetical protein
MMLLRRFGDWIRERIMDVLWVIAMFGILDEGEEN